MRVVLDTNVLVSALLIPNSTPSKILKQFRDGKWLLVISGAVLEEYGRVLRRKKFGLPLDQIESILKIIESRSVRVIPSNRFEVILEDPSDNEFLDVAVEGKADCIISGDGHLLSLNTFKDILILTPSAFIRRFG